MSNWEPQVVKIEKVIHHPNGDALDIAYVLGDYPVVVRRGEYKVDDLAAYLQVDTITPDTNQFYFLCPKEYEKYLDGDEIKQRQIGPKYPVGSVPEKYRVLKAKKIRNFYSEGMLVPVPIVKPIPLSLGDSVVEALSLKKYEEENEENLPNVFKAKGTNAAPPPKGWSIPYYDLENVRKYIKCVEEEKDIILTEKLNGSNASFCFDGNDLVVKSRNYYKKLDEEDDMWIELATRLNLKEKLSKYPMMVLFGECINQVKGFRYHTNLVDGKLLTNLICFDIFDVKAGKYLDYDDFITIIKDLDLESAPLLYRGPWTSKEEMYSFAEGKSILNDKIVREGWVLSLGKERFEPKLNSRCKLKLIGEGYNLSK
jgi:RNA ligase (TIGR02306 family)